MANWNSDGNKKVLIQKVFSVLSSMGIEECLIGKNSLSSLQSLDTLRIFDLGEGSEKDLGLVLEVSS